MLKSRNSRKRKNILINKDFQLSAINYVSSLFLIVSGLFYLGNYFLFRKLHYFGLEANLSLNDPYFVFIGNIKKFSNTYFFAILVLAFIVIYIGGFLLSHRIAGPIHKIKITIDRIIQNENVTEIVIRKGDYFHDLVGKLNLLLKKFNEQEAATISSASSETNDQ